MAEPGTRTDGDGSLSTALFSFPGGVHPLQHKRESTQRPISKLALPPRLIVPLSQHIGNTSVPIVNVGDPVLKGQKIARAEGYISVAQHAPSSGRIADIGDYPLAHPSGLRATCIVVDTDGAERWVEPTLEGDYTTLDPSHLRNLVRDAGVVGLGGAGFPTFIKLNPGAKKAIDTLIINAIECEPYITCDDMLMRERAQEVIAGARIMRHALQAREVIFAIEDNKPEALAALRAACADTDFRIVECPTVYPQGGEKQLIQVITGNEVPSSTLPVQMGIVVQNIATAVAVYHALVLGRPLVSRVVTVTGQGTRQPRNFDVLVGTPIQQLLDAADTAPQVDRVIMGGPMMGFAVHDTQAPIVKTTNCIMAMPPTRAIDAPALPCIRCGACADACPASLLPQQLYWFSSAKEFDAAQEHHLFDCIECGCCSYVCPSRIPLVHYYRYAKGEIWKKEQEKAKADVARQRHEFRLERIERDKRERAERHAKKREDLATHTTPATPDADAKKAAIEAAMARVKAKKAEQDAAKTTDSTPDNPSGPPS